METRPGDDLAIMMEAINTSNTKENLIHLSCLEAQLPKQIPPPSRISNPLLMAMPNLQERPPRWGARQKACAFQLKWAARSHGQVNPQLVLSLLENSG